jgi:DNA-binding NtrC family response regulator
MSYTLLIVHPDASVRSLMTSMLQSLGHRIIEAPNDRAAVRMLEHEPAHLVLAGWPEAAEADALEFLTYLRRKHPQVAVVLLWDSPHPERLREALQRGASSVLKFPLPATHLRAAVSQALGQPDPLQSPAPPRPNGIPAPAEAHPAMPAPRHAANGHHPAAGPGLPAAPARPDDPPGLVGDDPCLRQAIELAATIAPTRAPVLIVGARGTGKTLLARTLHSKSPRRDGPFVELSCAAMTESALEAELLGVRTAAGEERPGKLALAHGGTLVLEEVTALSPSLQYKLLRVLQDGEFEPVGSARPSHADVRLVLTTRDDLAPLVEQGTFRQDLYYRISVVSLKLPPLRHRGTDLQRLAEYFRARFSKEIGRDIVGFTPDALDWLRRHEWPGNVLELENVVERAVVHCRGPRIEPTHLALGLRPGPSPTARHAPPPRPHVPLGILPLKEALEGPEKQLILQALEALNWNRQETARVLDINRTTLYKKMKKYGLLFDEPAWAN